jgi:hypothetical protein
MATVLFNAIGYVFVFNIQEYTNQENVEAILRGTYRKPDLERIEIADLHQSDLNWESNMREVEYHGMYYDVVAQKAENGKLVLYCYNDYKEKEIKNKFHDFVKDQNHSDKTSKNVLLKKVFGQYVQTVSNELYKKQFLTLAELNTKSFVDFRVSIETGFPSMEIPPPKGYV